MKTEEKTHVPRIKIAVLGNMNVGKSALIVRFLTRRFIGEYRSNADLLYRQTLTINNIKLEIEIIDVSGETRDSPFPSEHVQWADACIVVYSITDKGSFQFAHEALKNLQKYRPVPAVLLANKADLEHLRECEISFVKELNESKSKKCPEAVPKVLFIFGWEDAVSAKETSMSVDEMKGRTVALQNSCQFYEISVAEDSSDLYLAFETLVNECRYLHQNSNQNKSRKFSVTKMIGTLIGANGKACSPIPHQGGTVVVCSKSDLHRNRILKRRQHYAATASL